MNVTRLREGASMPPLSNDRLDTIVSVSTRRKRQKFIRVGGALAVVVAGLFVVQAVDRNDGRSLQLNVEPSDQQQGTRAKTDRAHNVAVPPIDDSHQSGSPDLAEPAAPLADTPGNPSGVIVVPAPPSDHRPDAPTTGTVEGVVTSAKAFLNTGQHPHVWVELWDGHPHDSTLVASAEMRTDGTFRIVDVAPGTYQVQLSWIDCAEWDDVDRCSARWSTGRWDFNGDPIEVVAGEVSHSIFN